YWCHKHRRECRPVERAGHFLRRYTLDTLARLEEFARVRGRRQAEILHGDARELGLDGPFDAVVTSPPERELGAAAQGTSPAALSAYCEGVVNDRRELYPGILDRAGLRLESRYSRHVNRRTGRRAGEYFEDVLVAARA